MDTDSPAVQEFIHRYAHGPDAHSLADQAKTGIARGYVSWEAHLTVFLRTLIDDYFALLRREQVYEYAYTATPVLDGSSAGKYEPPPGGGWEYLEAIAIDNMPTSALTPALVAPALVVTWRRHRRPGQP